MASVIESEFIQIKSSLQKAIDEKLEDETNDILTILKGKTITKDLLTKTMIGKIVASVIKKFPDTKLSLLSTEIVNNWKKTCAIESASTTASSSSSSSSASVLASTESSIKLQAADVTSAIKLESNDTNSNKDTEIEDDIDDVTNEEIRRLPDQRRKIFDLFTDVFKTGASLANAKYVAYDVENAVHAKFKPTDYDSKAYLAKARSLLFNLKKNEALKFELIKGVLQAEELVELTIDQLASSEVKQRREKDLKTGILERRSDFQDITRLERMKSNGIDPNKGGEFTCRKCKQNKTVHSERQTRSADEPMTIFVACLTCGNRWRC